MCYPKGFEENAGNCSVFAALSRANIHNHLNFTFFNQFSCLFNIFNRIILFYF